MNKLYISYKDFVNHCNTICNTIKNNNIDINIILGLSRGGLMPSRYIAEILSINEVYTYGITSYDGQKKTNHHIVYQMPKALFSNKNILIVDDIADTGLSLKHALAHLKHKMHKKIYTCTIHYKPKSVFKPDFYAKEVSNETWIEYPWEIESINKTLK